MTFHPAKPETLARRARERAAARLVRDVEFGERNVEMCRRDLAHWTADGTRPDFTANAAEFLAAAELDLAAALERAKGAA